MICVTVSVKFPGVGGGYLKWIFKKWDEKACCTGLRWLRIGTGGGLL